MPNTALSALRKHQKHAAILGALYIAGFVFFMNTNPQELPLLLLILPFVYIFGVLYATILFVCRLIGLRGAVFTSVVISVFGVLLFVLGSLHQLTLRDVIISLALTCLLTWYATRIAGQRQ